MRIDTLTDLPQAGRYGVILADPPWRFATFSDKGRGRSPDGLTANGGARLYETMSAKDIRALSVSDIGAPNSVLLMWAIDPMLPLALSVGESWGYTYKTVGFYWAKTLQNSSQFAMGTGYWTRANPEQCLLFTKGKPKRISASVRRLIVSPRREHSRKPDEQYERIEQLVSGPYLEMFARQSRPGWDAWGNQTTKFNNNP